MKVGDLVGWKCPEIFNNHVRADPGLIMELRETSLVKSKLSATVRWADGRITTEHECYLNVIQEAAAEGACNNGTQSKIRNRRSTTN